jgi:hypothetical protein
MAYVTAQARQELLDTVAQATDEIGAALGALGEAYEQLDEQTADRLEAELFKPIQGAYGRARRTHSEFAGRFGLPTRTFAPATLGHGAASVTDQVRDAVEAAVEADDILAELQDSLRPVEVGDPELRAGLSEVRRLLGEIPGSADRFMRVLGR